MALAGALALTPGVSLAGALGTAPVITVVGDAGVVFVLAGAAAIGGYVVKNGVVKFRRAKHGVLELQPHAGGKAEFGNAVVDGEVVGVNRLVVAQICEHEAEEEAHGSEKARHCAGEPGLPAVTQYGFAQDNKEDEGDEREEDKRNEPDHGAYRGVKKVAHRVAGRGCRGKDAVIHGKGDLHAALNAQNHKVRAHKDAAEDTGEGFPGDEVQNKEQNKADREGKEQDGEQ